MTYIHTYYMSAPIAPGGQTSSAFYAHRTRTSTMFVKKERKKAFRCLSAFRKAGSSGFFLKFFFVYQLYTQRKI